MKKSLITFMLAGAIAVPTLHAQDASQQPAAAQPGAAAQQPAQPGAAQPAQPAQPAQKKEIKDPAEYNAYVAAVQQQDPAQKAVQLESFLQTYPNSVMKEDAAELLMAAYQQAGNVQKTIEAGNRVLQSNPNNLRALALLTYLSRTQAQGGDVQALQAAQQHGQRGLQALQAAQKPAEVSDADWTKLKQQVEPIFHGAVGLAALQNKDYPAAQEHLRAAVNANPTNFLDVYPLALAHLEKTPPDVEGLFWIARAVNLAPPQAKPNVDKFGKNRYTRYHGSDQGWTELVAASAQAQAPPAGFTVAPAPSPADQAREMVAEKDVKQMSFAEWQFILSSGNQEAADKVWTTIQGQPLQLVAQVISASPSKIELAATVDDIEAKRADVALSLKVPLAARRVPKAGETITFIGTPQSFTPNPFVMTMTDGSVKGAEAPAGKKPAAGRRSAPKKK
jgi:tetratricopeptide (TPR) repeat protein